MVGEKPEAKLLKRREKRKLIRSESETGNRSTAYSTV